MKHVRHTVEIVVKKKDDRGDIVDEIVESFPVASYGNLPKALSFTSKLRAVGATLAGGAKVVRVMEGP